MRIRFRRRRKAAVSVPAARLSDAVENDPLAPPSAETKKEARQDEEADLFAATRWLSLPETSDLLADGHERWAAGTAESPSPVTPAPSPAADDLCGQPTKSGRPCRWNVAARGACLAHRRVDASL
jgi:hypothetical protein